METLEEIAERKTNLFSYRNGYSTAKDAYIEGYKDCQSTFDKLPKVKAWIARDLNGDLFLFINRRPKKSTTYWYNYIVRTEIANNDLPEGINPQWEDEEPIEVELTINLKKG